MSGPAPVAFVLSGGGSLGAIQVGMLRVLYERGITPDLVVASSVGAINGAFIASRQQISDTTNELAAIWCNLTRGEVFSPGVLGSLLWIVGARSHLVSSSGLRALVTKHTTDCRLEELLIPLHVVAVDVVSGEELLLSTGSVVDAVMASAAIPAILPPVSWGDRTLMDGAVANNTPISHAIALGAGTVYVLPVGHACALEHPPATPLGMALHAFSLLTHSRLISEIEMNRSGRTKLIVLPPPCPLSVGPMDFRHASTLIERSAEETRAFLDEGGVERPSIRMRMHRHRRRAEKGARAPVALDGARCAKRVENTVTAVDDEATRC